MLNSEGMNFGFKIEIDVSISLIYNSSTNFNPKIISV